MSKILKTLFFGGFCVGFFSKTHTRVIDVYSLTSHASLTPIEITVEEENKTPIANGMIYGIIGVLSPAALFIAIYKDMLQV